MTERTSFLRKIGYGIAIAVIAFAMMGLSRPATTTKPGGKLAEMRKQYRLAQVNLGEVDPASETIKLATLGLRGVAVNALWEKANYYKKVEDWTNLTATLEQLAKLQPNFITFWKYQAWNLTYNVSVEFDDYKDRYYFVRRGIEFLKEGERYNVDHPQLLWDLGWFIGQKIGRADEYVQYRRLFRADDDFHPADRSQEDRDNWLVGKEWYLKAIDAVDNKGQSLGRKSPRDFYSSPAKSQMSYAEAIEEEGQFERARRAWIKAANEWREFGDRFIEHSFGVKLQLGSEERLTKEIAAQRAKLDAMMPGVREKLAAEKRAALTPEEQFVIETPREKLTNEQAELFYRVEPKLRVSDREIAERIAREDPSKEKAALLLAGEIERQDKQLDLTGNYKRDSNYDYWQTRADFEQTANALEARRLLFEAKKAFEETNMPLAKKLYDQGFDKWVLVIKEFPSIMDEEKTTGDDLLDYIKKYRDVLGQLDETIAEDFPLWEVIEKFDREQHFAEELAAHKKKKGEESGTPPAAGSAAPATAPASEPPAKPPETPAASPATTPDKPAESAPETPAASTPEAAPATPPVTPEASGATQ